MFENISFVHILRNDTPSSHRTLPGISPGPAVVHPKQERKEQKHTYGAALKLEIFKNTNK